MHRHIDKCRRGVSWNFAFVKMTFEKLMLHLGVSFRRSFSFLALLRDSSQLFLSALFCSFFPFSVLYFLFFCLSIIFLTFFFCSFLILLALWSKKPRNETTNLTLSQDDGRKESEHVTAADFKKNKRAVQRKQMSAQCKQMSRCI